MTEAKEPVITWGRKNKRRELDEGGELLCINYRWTRRVKLSLVKEFKYKYSQTQSMFAVLNIVTGWALFKAIFSLKKMEKVRVA